jgi:phenylacetate-CoA ligase
VAEDGTVLHGLALIYILRDLPGIESFKITQHDLQHVTVQIVADSAAYEKSSEQAIEQVFKKRLGAGISVDFEYVAEIAKEKSGKFRYVISHVEIK